MKKKTYETFMKAPLTPNEVNPLKLVLVTEIS